MVQLEYRGKGTFCVGRKWFVCELVEMVGRDAVLPLSCTVCCGLLFLEKMAATGIKTASKLADFETSLAVSAA